MDIPQMQQRIDAAESAAAMIAVAEGYLDGEVLRDPVAAEAWLMRAIETEDPVQAPKAMAVLAARILKKAEVLSDSDYQDIRRQARTAAGQERDALLGLLALGSRRQKNMAECDDNELQI